MNEIYAVEISGGSYDDYYKYIRFVSASHSTCADYIEKYNRVLNKGKEYYKQFENNYDSSYDGRYDKYIMYDDLHYARLITIEIR